MDFSQHVEFQYPGRILTIVEPLESCFVNVFIDSLSTIRLTLLAVDPNIGTVPLETTEPCTRSKTSSLPNVFTANSPRWDENRNRGKDESNRKPR